MIDENRIQYGRSDLGTAASHPDRAGRWAQFAPLLRTGPESKPPDAEATRIGQPLQLAQRGPDEVISASGRAIQSLALPPIVAARINTFLGEEIGRDEASRTVSAYFTYQPMPSEIMRPGLYGGAGIDPDGNAFAVVDTGQIGDRARQFGVSPDQTIATITAQEVLHAATFSHPSLRGRFTTEDTEVLGEAFSLRYGSLDYLPFHLSIVGNSATTARQPGSEGYTAFSGISNPAIMQSLRAHGIDLEGTDDATTFLTQFMAYADRQRLVNLLGGPLPEENVVIAFARDVINIGRPEKFADDLLIALDEAYGKCANQLLEDGNDPSGDEACHNRSAGQELFPRF